MKLKRYHRLLILPAAIFVTLAVIFFLSRVKNPDKISDAKTRISLLKVKDSIISVEIADTPEKRQQGLMYRKTMKDNEGMLFIFETEDFRTFWMKNTLIPLDMVWMDPNYKVIYITKDAQPCVFDPCEMYVAPAKYVLELKGGWSDRNNLQVGDSIQLIK